MRVLGLAEREGIGISSMYRTMLRDGHSPPGITAIRRTISRRSPVCWRQVARRLCTTPMGAIVDGSHPAMVGAHRCRAGYSRCWRPSTAKGRVSAGLLGPAGRYDLSGYGDAITVCKR